MQLIKKRIIPILAIMLLTTAFLCGCGDEEYEYYADGEDYEYEESDEEYEESGEEYEESDEEYEESDENYDEYEESGSSDSADGAEMPDFPRGTCDKLEGTTVVVSVFADTQNGAWNFENTEDVQMYQNMSTRMRIGLDWLESVAANYGKSLKFESDFETDNDLYFTGSLDCDMSDGQFHCEEVRSLLESGLTDKIPTLLSRYNADNIAFAFFFNEPSNTNMVSCAYPYWGSMADYYNLPYECAMYSSYTYGSQQGPAMYAHELLHLFGAPDLYRADTNNDNMGISQEFVDYCQQNHLNEIMYSNYDVYNNCVNFDAVTNDFTDLTAYYVGWVDECEDCVNFGMTQREEK